MDTEHGMKKVVKEVSTFPISNIWPVIRKNFPFPIRSEVSDQFRDSEIKINGVRVLLIGGVVDFRKGL